MAKRGQRYPYRVSYEWDNGIGGSQPRRDREHADTLADLIIDNAESSNRGVTVAIVHVSTGGTRTVVDIRTAHPED